MQVKSWVPKKGCSSCADAKRIMDNQSNISKQVNSVALKKIRELQNEIDLLNWMLKDERKESEIP